MCLSNIIGTFTTVHLSQQHKLVIKLRTRLATELDQSLRCLSSIDSHRLINLSKTEQSIEPSSWPSSAGPSTYISRKTLLLHKSSLVSLDSDWQGIGSRTWHQVRKGPRYWSNCWAPLARASSTWKGKIPELFRKSCSLSSTTRRSDGTFYFQRPSLDKGGKF